MRKVVLTQILFVIIFGLSIFLSKEASAQGSFLGIQSSTESSDPEKAMRLRAKNRTYPGGRDEDPLRVQAQLTFANRKMQPVKENVEDSEPEPGVQEND